MEFLKPIFEGNALTFEQLCEALKSSKDIKLANLADGEYVSRQKYDDKQKELDTANGTIATLQDTVKQFDGVDVKKLNQDIADLKQKYDDDTSALKLNSAVDIALMGAKTKNVKVVKAMLEAMKNHTFADTIRSWLKRIVAKRVISCSHSL